MRETSVTRSKQANQLPQTKQNLPDNFIKNTYILKSSIQLLSESKPEACTHIVKSQLP